MPTRTDPLVAARGRRGSRRCPIARGPRRVSRCCRGNRCAGTGLLREHASGARSRAHREHRRARRQAGRGRLAARGLVASLRGFPARRDDRRRARRQPVARGGAGAHRARRRRGGGRARCTVPASLRQCRRDLPALFGELHLSAAVRRQLGERQPVGAQLRLRNRLLEQERRRAGRRAVAGSSRRRRPRHGPRAAHDQHRPRLLQSAAALRAARGLARRDRAARRGRPHHHRALCRGARHQGRGETGRRCSRHRHDRARPVRRRDRHDTPSDRRPGRCRAGTRRGAGRRSIRPIRRRRARPPRCRSTSSRAARRSSRRAGASKQRATTSMSPVPCSIPT